MPNHDIGAGYLRRIQKRMQVCDDIARCARTRHGIAATRKTGVAVRSWTVIGADARELRDTGEHSRAFGGFRERNTVPDFAVISETRFKDDGRTSGTATLEIKRSSPDVDKPGEISTCFWCSGFSGGEKRCSQRRQEQDGSQNKEPAHETPPL